MGFDFDSAGFAGGPVAEAAPWVVLGLFAEAADFGVTVHIAELFDALVFGEDVEVVVAALPELIALAFEATRGFAFEDTEQGGQWNVGRFAQEKVDVLGHEDVAADVEMVAFAEGFEDFFEGLFGVGRSEEWEALVTAKGDEVEVAGLLIAF